MPVVGDEVYAGGGYAPILRLRGQPVERGSALRHAAARGRVVLLGCAGRIPKLDLTFLWAKELRVAGYVGYGMEEWGGRRQHTFDITLARMQADPGALDSLVTHVFPLSQYRDALRAAFDHRRSGAVKVALQPLRRRQRSDVAPSTTRASTAATCRP